MVVPSQISIGQSVTVRCCVTTVGPVVAEEIVQLYLSDLEASVETPIHSLVGFQRIALRPGERQEITFTVLPDQMMVRNDEGSPHLEPGLFRLTVGGCSPGERGQALGAAESPSAVFRVIPTRIF